MLSTFPSSSKGEKLPSGKKEGKERLVPLPGKRGKRRNGVSHVYMFLRRR